MSEEKKQKVSNQSSDKKNEAAINLEGWKKALADYQNLQKETDKKMSQLHDFALTSVVRELLPIFDNYEIALSHVPAEQKNESWVQGLEHTMKLWQNFLRDHSIQKIVSMGEVFDPNQHEAVGHITDQEKNDQIIVQELQAGYLCQNIILRPAKVIINNIN
jgi:molecular chaperone GrpE